MRNTYHGEQKLYSHQEREKRFRGQGVTGAGRRVSLRRARDNFKNTGTESLKIATVSAPNNRGRVHATKAMRCGEERRGIGHAK